MRNLFSISLFLILTCVITFQQFSIFELQELNKEFAKTPQKITPTVNIINSELVEPSESSYSTDSLERIDLLKQHLIFNPSKEWISNVLNCAVEEINQLKKSQNNDIEHYHRHSNGYVTCPYSGATRQKNKN